MPELEWDIINFDHYCDRYVSPFVWRGILFDLLQLFIGSCVLNARLIGFYRNVFSLAK